MTRVAALIATILLGFALSGFLTWLVRRYTLSAGILDRSSARSSHVGEVPRGGGLAIVMTLFIGLSILWSSNAFGEPRIPVELLVTMVLMALVGWLDDLRILTVWHKFAALFLVSAVMAWFVGPLSEIEFAGYRIETGAMAPVLTVLWIFGLANSYNFMDGIDGLAAGQGAVAGCAFGVWFTLAGAHALALFCYALMAACMGFLLWNWSPARIFMGDIGSLALGGTFAVLTVIGYKYYSFPVGAAVLLFGVFIADTFITFVRRAAAGKQVWSAHREHYYQRAVQSGYSHSQVTVALILTGIGCMVLATLELMRIDPRYLWYVAGAVLLSALAVYVSRREKRNIETI